MYIVNYKNNLTLLLERKENDCQVYLQTVEQTDDKIIE